MTSRTLGTHSLRTSILQWRITKHGIIIAAGYLLLFGICFAWFQGAGSLAFVLSLAVILASICASPETSVCMLFVCFPFFNVMGKELGGTSLYYLLILIAVAKMFVSGRVDRPVNRLVTYLLIIALTIYNASAGQLYLKWLIHLLVPFLLLGSQNLRDWLPKYIWFLTISFLVADIAGFLMVRSGIYLYTGGEVWTAGELTTRYAGLVGDPVFFSQVSAVIVAANSFLVYKHRALRLTVPMSGLLVFFALLAYSKAGMLCIAIVLVADLIAFIAESARGRLPVRNLVIAMIALVAGYAVIRAFLAGSTAFSVDALNTRLASNDLLTGRMQIWQGYFNLWQKEGISLLFKGIGFDTYSSTYVWSRFNKCHNLYIEAITLFGVILAVIMFVLLIWFFIHKVRQGASVMAFLPAMVLLATGFVLHGFIDTPFFYEWTVALGCLDYAAALHQASVLEPGCSA